MGKCQNDKYICGKRGDIQHYFFDRCFISDDFFDFIQRKSLEWNVLLSQSIYNMLRGICNDLNKNFWFM